MSYTTALDLTRAHCSPRMFSPEANDSAPDDPLDWDPSEHPNPYTDHPDRKSVVSGGVAHSTMACFHVAAALAAERQSYIETMAYRGRRKQFTEFAWNSGGLRYDRAMHYVRVFDAIPQAFWEEFRGFEWTTILAVEKHTRLPGDSAGDRRSRILRVLTEAKARNFGDAGTLALVAETLERDRLERFGAGCDPHLPTDIGRDSAAGVPGPAEAPPERRAVTATVSGESVDAYVDQTHAFVGDPHQPDLPAPDVGLRALVQSLQQQVDELRAQMSAFGQPVDTEALVERVREGFALKLYRDLGVSDKEASRIAQEAENRVRTSLRGLVVYRKAGA